MIIYSYTTIELNKSLFVHIRLCLSYLRCLGRGSSFCSSSFFCVIFLGSAFLFLDSHVTLGSAGVGLLVPAVGSVGVEVGSAVARIPHKAVGPVYWESHPQARKRPQHV